MALLVARRDFPSQLRMESKVLTKTPALLLGTLPGSLSFMMLETAVKVELTGFPLVLQVKIVPTSSTAYTKFCGSWHIESLIAAMRSINGNVFHQNMTPC